MIEHFKIALFIIIAVIGTIVITYTANIKNQHKEYYLKWLILYLISFNASVVLDLTRKYSLINITHGIKSYKLLYDINIDLSLICQYFMLISVLSLCSELLNKKFGKSIKIFQYIIVPLLTAFFVLKYIFYSNYSFLTAVNIIGAIISLSGDVLIILTFITLSFYSILLVDKSNKTLNISLSVMLGTPTLLYFLIHIPFIFEERPFSRTIMSSIILSIFFLYNVLPFLWLSYFYKPYKLQQIQSKPYDQKSIDLDKYSVSQREMEIINLILEGKTNKEIETSLFLSSHTVKNHIYHIYQKLGVKSRFQLITLFRTKE